LGCWDGQDGCGKSPSPLGFDPRTVQPAANRYTDLAMPTHQNRLKKKEKAGNKTKADSSVANVESPTLFIGTYVFFFNDANFNIYHRRRERL
jgi:hypothetical protein